MCVHIYKIQYKSEKLTVFSFNRLSLSLSFSFTHSLTTRICQVCYGGSVFELLLNSYTVQAAVQFQVGLIRNSVSLSLFRTNEREQVRDRVEGEEERERERETKSVSEEWSVICINDLYFLGGCTRLDFSNSYTYFVLIPNTYTLLNNTNTSCIGFADKREKKEEHSNASNEASSHVDTNRAKEREWNKIFLSSFDVELLFFIREYSLFFSLTCILIHRGKRERERVTIYVFTVLS